MKIDRNSYNDSNQENRQTRNRPFERSNTEYINKSYIKTNPFQRNSSPKDNPFSKSKTVSFKTPAPTSSYNPFTPTLNKNSNPFKNQHSGNQSGEAVRIGI